MSAQRLAPDALTLYDRVAQRSAGCVIAGY